MPSSAMTSRRTGPGPGPLMERRARRRPVPRSRRRAGRPACRGRGPAAREPRGMRRRAMRRHRRAPRGCPGPKWNGMAPGGERRSRFVPSPARSGTSATSAAAGLPLDRLAASRSRTAPSTRSSSAGPIAGRSAGTTTSAVAPISRAHARPSARPSLRPPPPWGRVTAPESAATASASGSGLTTATARMPGVMIAARIVRRRRPSTSARRSSGSSASPRRVFARSNPRTGTTATRCPRSAAAGAPEGWRSCMR